MALSFFLILLPGLPVKNSLPVEQTHSANIISFSIYENENEPRLDDFLPLFVCFGTKIFSQHQISTTLLGLVRENRATPVLTRSLVRSPTSTPKPRAEGRVRASGTHATAPFSAAASVDVALPPGNSTDRPARSKSALNVIAFSQVFSSATTCPHPPPSLSEPKTHPVLPFLGFSGCVFSFFSLWTHIIFGLAFVHSVA